MKEKPRNPIRFVKGLETAHKILDAINRIGVTVPQDALFVHSFDNCREQGLTIKVYPPGRRTHYICFANWRGNDEIVVYDGRDFELADAHITPTERVGENARFFPPGAVEEAAHYIIGIVERRYRGRNVKLPHLSIARAQ